MYKVLQILKTWMDYCEGLARSCGHLNFPAHFSTKKNKKKNAQNNLG